MSRISQTVAVAAVAIAVSVGVTQAGGAAPAHVATLSPPVIHEPPMQLACPKHPIATPDLEGCAEQRLHRTDAQVDALVRTIFRELVDRIAQQGFVSGEKSWLAFRMRDCDGMSQVNHGGTIQGLVYLNCEVTRNKERLTDLRAFRSSFSN